MQAKIKLVSIKKVDLKKLRKKSGLSLRKLARLSKVSYSLISNYERGILRMEEATWEKIAAVLNKYTNK